jgi:hypothetical protein
VILIGFIIVAAVVALGVDIGMENSHSRLSIEAFGHAFSQRPWVVIVIGAVCGAMAIIGLSAMASGAARRRRLWLEHRGAVRERDRLAKQLADLRAGRDQTEPVREASTTSG